MKTDLFKAALDADARLDRVIATQFPGKTRWTLSPDECAHPEVESAYRAKVKADQLWLDALSGKTPEPAKGLSLDEAKAHLAERAKEGVFEMTWDQLEKRQGGKLTRPK